jgi:diadenosine tetraphosphate (Ap4A) HIT family hydrolase
MLYNYYLKKMKKCPFCNLDKDEILKENKYSVLILAQAPYTKGHLLVIPKRHVLRLNSLTKKEKDKIEELTYYGIRKLHKKYNNVNILYREGNKKEIGKSINHIHYHLIPEMKIGSNNIKGETRKIDSHERYLKNIKKIKKELKI